MCKILPNNEITEAMNSLNSMQREFLNVVHKWRKEHIKCNGHNLEPFLTFFGVVEELENFIW